MEDRRGQGGGLGGAAVSRSRWARGRRARHHRRSSCSAFCSAGNIFGGGRGRAAFARQRASSRRPRPRRARQPTKARHLFEFTKFVSKDTQDTWTKPLQRRRASTRARPSSRSRRHRKRLRPGVVADRPVLLPGRQQGVPRPLVLPGAVAALRRPGDFARAYVIAHEIGHHVQTVLGIEGNVRRKQQDDPANANLYLVRLELQADCFAGVWAHSTYERGLLEPGDVEEGLTAAAAVGDDRLGRTEPRAVDARLVRAADGVVPPGLRVRQPGRLRHRRRPGLSAGLARAAAAIPSPERPSRRKER